MTQLIEAYTYITTWIEVKLYQIFADDGRRLPEDYTMDTTKDI